MIKMGTLPYKEVDFVFVSNHWDVHLEGLCRYNGELHKFKTEEENGELHCVIYKMSDLDKLHAVYDKKLFEWMVGYHWSYPQRKEGAGFYYRKPQWLYKRLFKLYYNKRFKALMRI